MWWRRRLGWTQVHRCAEAGLGRDSRIGPPYRRGKVRPCGRHRRHCVLRGLSRKCAADQVGASRGEPQRRGLRSTWEGRWRRRTHLAQGHRAGNGCVRDGVTRRLRRVGTQGRRGAETPKTEVREQGCARRHVLTAGTPAGRRRELLVSRRSAWSSVAGLIGGNGIDSFQLPD